MSAPWVLFAAEQGVNLLGALSSLGTTRATQAAIAGQARTMGALERFQIQRVARQDAMDRRNRLAGALGSQRAALGAVGVSGGRTAGLLEARSLLNAQEEESRAKLQTLTALQASQVREEATARGAGMRSSQAGTQFGLDIFGQLIGAGLQAQTLLEQEKAMR